MRIDKNNVFLFDAFNKYGIIKRTYRELFEGNFTIATTVSPDYDSILKEYEEDFKQDVNSGYKNCCIVGATGQHTGAFISLHYILSKPIFTFTYRWFEENDGEEKKLVVPLNHNLDLILNIVIYKFDSNFHVDINGTKTSLPHGNIINYQDAYKWVGCANNLGVGTEGYDKQYASIFEGDITKLHIQNSLMSKAEIKQLFNDYKSFKANYLYQDNGNSVLFSSDFSEFTPYKIKDFSVNNNNIIKYDPMWFTD